MSMRTVEDAKEVLKAEGYVVLKARSYHQAQERQRTERVLREAAERQIASTERWARECCDRERFLSDRCTYLYGLAAELGANDEQLHRVRFDPSPAASSTVVTERGSVPARVPTQGERLTEPSARPSPPPAARGDQP